MGRQNLQKTDVSDCFAHSFCRRLLSNFYVSGEEETEVSRYGRQGPRRLPGGPCVRSLLGFLCPLRPGSPAQRTPRPARPSGYGIRVLRLRDLFQCRDPALGAFLGPHADPRRPGSPPQRPPGPPPRLRPASLLPRMLFPLPGGQVLPGRGFIPCCLLSTAPPSPRPLPLPANTVI